MQFVQPIIDEILNEVVKKAALVLDESGKKNSEVNSAKKEAIEDFELNVEQFENSSDFTYQADYRYVGKRPPFRCNFCHLPFFYGTILAQHLMENHKKAENGENSCDFPLQDSTLPFKCYFCDLSYLSARKLAQHMTKKHKKLFSATSNRASTEKAHQFDEKFEKFTSDEKLMQTPIKMEILLESRYLDEIVEDNNEDGNHVTEDLAKSKAESTAQLGSPIKMEVIQESRYLDEIEQDYNEDGNLVIKDLAKSSSEYTPQFGSPEDENIKDFDSFILEFAKSRVHICHLCDKMFSDRSSLKTHACQRIQKFNLTIDNLQHKIRDLEAKNKKLQEDIHTLENLDSDPELKEAMGMLNELDNTPVPINKTCHFCEKNIGKSYTEHLLKMHKCSECNVYVPRMIKHFKDYHPEVPISVPSKTSEPEPVFKKPEKPPKKRKITKPESDNTQNQASTSSTLKTSESEVFKKPETPAKRKKMTKLEVDKTQNLPKT